MHKDRKCSACGGLDEFAFEIHGRALYYCAACNIETSGSGSELVGPAERREEETGE